MYWNEYETKSENRDTTEEYKNLLESNVLGVNRLFVSVKSKAANNAQNFKAITNQKVFVVTGKNFYGHPNDSDKNNTKK